MPYGGITRFFHLPYMRRGDYMTAEQEEERARIIDHLLYVATYGASAAMIEDPAFTLSDGGTRWRLTLSPAGGEFTFLAIANYRLAYREGEVSLDLPHGSFYYIYITYGAGMETDPTRCGLEVRTEPLDAVGHVLLCTVDARNTPAVLDDMPEDKPYLVNLASHSGDALNPHGTLLTQNALRVVNWLTVKGRRIRPVIYETLDSPGAGATAYVVPPEGFTPFFAIASPADASAGACGCEIQSDGRIKITNTGAAQIPITVRIEEA